MKWVLVALLVFSGAVGAGVYLLKGRGTGTGIEIDWRQLNQLDYITNTAPDELKKIDGQLVKIPGFMVPLEDEQSRVTEFLLVPTPTACIHVPPPPPNQMIYVKMKEGVEARPGAPIWVYGKFSITTHKSQYGDVSFGLEGDEVEDYR
ncbi:MAG: hypothetical protein K0R29_2329 [Pseudobdellovibrio sp.]|jgi:hypothetical protein|nr:hypothetical protein [Pseudobdellovibrio sp.]